MSIVGPSGKRMLRQSNASGNYSKAPRRHSDTIFHVFGETWRIQPMGCCDSPHGAFNWPISSSLKTSRSGADRCRAHMIKTNHTAQGGLLHADQNHPGTSLERSAD